MVFQILLVLIACTSQILCDKQWLTYTYDNLCKDNGYFIWGDSRSDPVYRTFNDITEYDNVPRFAYFGQSSIRLLSGTVSTPAQTSTPMNHVFYEGVNNRMWVETPFGDIIVKNDKPLLVKWYTYLMNLISLYSDISYTGYNACADGELLFLWNSKGSVTSNGTSVAGDRGCAEVYKMASPVTPSGLAVLSTKAMCFQTLRNYPANFFFFRSTGAANVDSTYTRELIDNTECTSSINSYSSNLCADAILIAEAQIEACDNHPRCLFIETPATNDTCYPPDGLNSNHASQAIRDFFDEVLGTCCACLTETGYKSANKASVYFSLSAENRELANPMVCNVSDLGNLEKPYTCNDSSDERIETTPLMLVVLIVMSFIQY